MMSSLLHPDDMDRLISQRQARLLPTLRLDGRPFGLRTALGRALIAAGTALVGDRATARPPKVAHHSRSL